MLMLQNYIDGSNDNPILTLAEKMKDICYEPPDGHEAYSHIYGANGAKIDSDKAMEHSAIAWAIVDEAIRYSRADKGASIPPEKSLVDYFEGAIQARGYSDDKALLVKDLADMWSNIVGEPIHKQSLRYMWLEECIEGGKREHGNRSKQSLLTDMLLENWFLASTYKAILEEVYRECSEQADIQLNKKVTRVVSHRNHDKDSYAVSVIVDDNTTHFFDEVVVTAPLGWLKRNKPVFAPPLPPNIANAIDHIGYGRLEKVYINFSHAYWQSGAPGTVKPFIFQFLTPDYAPEHNSNRRTIECVSLAALPPRCDHATLLFYINGPTSEYVTSLVQDCRRGSEGQHQKLKAFFSPYYSRLPNYDANTCEPVDFCSTDWQHDELAGNGSYSTYQVSDSAEGLIELDKDIDMLRVGLPERHLWFAGEHTAPTLALGTTTGAYWSGAAVADRLQQVYARGREHSSKTACYG